MAVGQHGMETYALRTRALGWRRGRFANFHGAGRRELGGAVGRSQSRGLMAGVHGLFLDALDLHGCWPFSKWSAISSLRRRAERCRCSSARELSAGALSGATLGSAAGSWIAGIVAGVVGAVVGTLGGAESTGPHGEGVRARYACSLHRGRRRDRSWTYRRLRPPMRSPGCRWVNRSGRGSYPACPPRLFVLGCSNSRRRTDIARSVPTDSAQPHRIARADRRRGRLRRRNLLIHGRMVLAGAFDAAKAR